jgi:hypothetical protein
MPKERYGGADGAHSLDPRPGDPSYVTVEDATREILEQRRQYEATPHAQMLKAIAARREADKKAEREAKRKRPAQTTDYPWLKPGWKW